MMELVAVVQICPEPEWYRLEFAERCRLRGEIGALLAACENVKCRWYDAEPWTGSIAEFVVCEFSTLQAYWGLWNELREATVFRKSYARIGHVSLGYERPLSIGLVDT